MAGSGAVGALIRYLGAMASLRPLLPVLLLTGCTEYELSEFDATDVFLQNPWEKVDVLVVVDNSG